MFKNFLFAFFFWPKLGRSIHLVVLDALVVTCVLDTSWLAHVMRDRFGDPHGGGLTVTGGWSCGRCNLSGVLVMTVWGSWWCVGVTTLSLSALVEGQTLLA